MKNESMAKVVTDGCGSTRLAQSCKAKISCNHVAETEHQLSERSARPKMPDNITKSDEAHCSGNVAASVGVSDGAGDVAQKSNEQREQEKAMRASCEPDESATTDDEEMVLTYSEAERFITFTDAVVAIAMTLLILPLMEAAADIIEEEGGEGEGEEGDKMTVEDYFSQNKHKVGSFFLSFWVVSIFWVWHDKLFRYVGRFSRFLLTLNFLWMLGLVFLPVATSLLTATPDTDKLALIVYIGTMLWTSFCGGLMVQVIRRDSRIWKGDRGPGKLAVISNLIHDVLLLIALLISIFSKVAGAYSLIVLVTQPIIMKLVRRRWPELR